MLFTLGYEGLSIEEFVGALVEAGVEALIDVRWDAISRKKGFAKSALKGHLEAAGIGYVHERRVGTPRELRAKVREDGDYDALFRAYAEHLDAEAEGFAAVFDRVTRAVCCLMCYERDVTHCHRSVLAERLVAASEGRLQVQHLVPET